MTANLRQIVVHGPSRRKILVAQAHDSSIPESPRDGKIPPRSKRNWGLIMSSPLLSC